MLYMLGSRKHPAIKVGAGIIAIAIGVALHAMVMAVMGGVLVVWGGASAISAARKGAHRASHTEDSGRVR